VSGDESSHFSFLFNYGVFTLTVLAGLDSP
jgi:hypothetical protein